MIVEMSGFQKYIIFYVSCVAILIFGVFSGINNIYNVEYEDSSFWAGKRVEYSQYLSILKEDNFDEVPASFFISKPVYNEQSMRVESTHNIKSIEVGEVLPSDILFQNECRLFDNEYESESAGSVSFLLDESNQKVFLTFLFDLEEYNKQRKENIVKNCLSPIIISVIMVSVLLCINIYSIRRNLFNPIKKISMLSRNICNGDYSQDYLQVNEIHNEADEVTDLVSSFELMRDELKAKHESAERLKQSEKELISCMSHDLQTPLSTIKAYTEAIRDNVAQNEEEKQKYLEVILKKTNTMINMIRDLLTYSNSQLGQLPMEFSDIMLKDYFLPLLEELKNYAKQKEVELVYLLDDNNILMHIDPKRMTQVFYNLVENSMKYMDKAQKRIDISVKLAGRCVHVKVQDNGIGIASEEILYIFDKFYRAEKSRTSSVPGSGLGLSICKYIMEQHGGEIWCESKQDVGSTFYLVLPLE